MTQKLQEITGVTVEHETTFKDLTTLRIGGSPRATVHCETAEAAVAALRVLEEVPYLVVGGGSNLVVAESRLWCASTSTISTSPWPAVWSARMQALLGTTSFR